MKRNDLDIYDRYAAQWWDGSERWLRVLHNMVPARLRYFERFAGDWAGRRVLDLGCGGGFLAEALARRGAVVSGIDPSEGAIEAARAHAAGEGLEIGYAVGVGEALPYEDGSFDHVVCVDVLEHVTSVERTLAEVARVLRPGGMFLYDTINRTALARLAVVSMAEDVLRLLPRGTHDPALFIRPAELHAMMRKAGLAPGPITGLGPRGLNRRGDFTFGTVPLKSVIYMGTAVAGG
ncbi:3-demethylubiquinone-9 3-O-methyltransferase [Halovulum dunhuangense]|uniref:3-demethylubiquinone-9 3-O-methyltransferase n=1 Tax=Halovulum dunhuangense TaxID=1505036 RepID=A0A849L6A9_9RHOB|nr:bifunctional 2-polyprenyl-6-hydroxyphenol methylase/3-demethylubiquinol 3-O-methyltransferase UbiG [Halovulum dunhuangense]NNU81627.1 3-demethylubiquinone-9 3-O-methyltransferase [Halovulum dunhuangense]